MNSLPKILCRHDMLGFFQQKFFGSMWTAHFDIQAIDPSKTYDKQDCLIWIDRYDNDDWIQPFYEAGYKIIYNYLWDSNVHDPIKTMNNVLHLHSKNWIWINEHCMYKHWGYQHQIQQPSRKYFMLMLMNLRRAHRSQALLSMQKFLHDSLYSYVGQGITIADDFVPNSQIGINDRFFNPRWYSQSAFSMVMETSVDDELFISEKSFKPMAHCHPFVIYGTPGTLDHLRSLGFQTFDNIIDESYDLESNALVPQCNVNGDYITSMNRLEKIIKVLDHLYSQFQQHTHLFADAESQRRIQHNHALFYDSSVIQNLWTQEIIDPIKEFANA